MLSNSLVLTKLTYSDLKDFINKASSFESPIDMQKGRYVIDAKSVMGVLSLDFSEGVTVVLHSNNNKEIERFNSEMGVYL